MPTLRKLNKLMERRSNIVDYSNLRGAIRAKFKTQEAFAKALHVSPCGLSNKLNGKTEWTAGEIHLACDLLDLSAEDIPKYFFCPKC